MIHKIVSSILQSNRIVSDTNFPLKYPSLAVDLQRIVLSKGEYSMEISIKNDLPMMAAHRE